MKQNWQKVPKIKEPKWRNGYRDITLYAVNLGERFRVFPYDENGELDPEAVTKIEQALADKDTRAVHAVHPRLIKLLYKLAVRFDARQINVISGYREESEGSESHHANGTAVDFMIPGVKLAALAKVARRLGHVGVGYYPTSGFIHLDVREKRSYFWVDPSGPGKHSCIRQIMKNHGPKFDRQWKPDMDEPEQKKNRKGEVLDSSQKSTKKS
ncbi:MAG: YcbK family protein [Deltaproteobacteria bacterium]|nr:YcbK family protein [Deltaproteobacteria bacterium]MBN2672220.1 YcbK family protein [Deltaproteobacteria bacterium]